MLPGALNEYDTGMVVLVSYIIYFLIGMRDPKLLVLVRDNLDERGLLVVIFVQATSTSWLIKLNIRYIKTVKTYFAYDGQNDNRIKKCSKWLTQLY